MKLVHVMNRDVTVLPPDAPLTQAFQALQEKGADAAAICIADRLLGVVTLSDIRRWVSASDAREVTHAKVRDVMRPEVVCCYADEDVDACVSAMCERRLECVPVVDRRAHLVGIVSRAALTTTTGHVPTPSHGPAREAQA